MANLSRVLVMFIVMFLLAIFLFILTIDNKSRAKTSIAPNKVLTIKNESADTIYIEIN